MGKLVNQKILVRARYKDGDTEMYLCDSPMEAEREIKSLHDVDHGYEEPTEVEVFSCLPMRVELQRTRKVSRAIITFPIKEQST